MKIIVRIQYYLTSIIQESANKIPKLKKIIKNGINQKNNACKIISSLRYIQLAVFTNAYNICEMNFIYRSDFKFIIQFIILIYGSTIQPDSSSANRFPMLRGRSGYERSRGRGWRGRVIFRRRRRSSRVRRCLRGRRISINWVGLRG